MTEIKAGPELDRAVAEAIGIELHARYGVSQFVTMREWLALTGAKQCPECEEGGSFHEMVTQFEPSIDLNTAFAAAEKVGLWKECGYCQASGQHVISKTIPVKSWDDTIAHADTPALAICAAILKLKGKHG